MRQVFQHLTNPEITAALHNILRRYSLVFVTEHIYLGPNAKPNIDMPHGPGTRVPDESGVQIDLPPFSTNARTIGDIAYAPNEVLRTWAVQGTGVRPCAISSPLERTPAPVLPV